MDDLNEFKDKYIRALEDLIAAKRETKDAEGKWKECVEELATTAKQLSDEKRRVADCEDTIHEKKLELEKAHDKVGRSEKLIEELQEERDELLEERDEEIKALKEEVKQLKSPEHNGLAETEKENIALREEVKQLKSREHKGLAEKEEEINALREELKQLKSGGRKGGEGEANGVDDDDAGGPSSPTSDAELVPTSRKPMIRHQKPIAALRSAPPSAKTPKRTNRVVARDSNVSMNNNPDGYRAFTDVMDTHFPHLNTKSDRRKARQKLCGLLQKHGMKDDGTVPSEFSNLPSKAVPLKLVDEFLEIIRREFGATDDGVDSLSGNEEGNEEDGEGVGNMCLRSVLRAAEGDGETDNGDGETDDESGADWDRGSSSSNNVAVVVDNASTTTAGQKRGRDETDAGTPTYRNGVPLGVGLGKKSR
ncbi:hypothetical protein HK104_008700 [Borealophlyctis nickersoniae]|nr:hypothetical protein HK104_008700 [Borealophlyctis nickersoniae]